jgi:hypothetical protein
MFDRIIQQGSYLCPHGGNLADWPVPQAMAADNVMINQANELASDQQGADFAVGPGSR